MIISDSLDSISVNKAADWLDVRRSGFYKWFHLSMSTDNDQNSKIQNKEERQYTEN